MLQFAHAVQALGIATIVVGAVRIVRAPVQAARRGARSAELIPIDGRRPTSDIADGAAQRARYERGLTDFYRISGAVAVLAGILLVVVPLFAG